MDMARKRVLSVSLILVLLLAMMPTAQAAVNVSSIKLSKKSATLYVGGTLSLTASVKPTNATNKSITWTSSNEKAAKVDEKGRVTAVGAGKATITAKSVNGKKASCSVTIKVPVTGVTMTKSALTLQKGKSKKLTWTIAPSNASDKAVIFTSSAKSVATVDKKGKVTAKKPGTATITVKTKNGGYTARTTVTVVTKIINVTGVRLSNTSLSIEPGKTKQLTATVSPADALDKSVTWTTSNANVAKVDAKGLVTAVSFGKATVTATTSNGKTAMCDVTVEVSATDVKLSETSVSLEPGKTKQLSATVSPPDTTNKTVTWTTSDAGVAKVDSKGFVTAAGVGRATITAKVSSGKSATCEVTVAVPATGVTLSATMIGIEVGQTYQLSATVLPTNVTDKSVTWTTSDAGVAKVDANGLVTGVGTGVTAVMAKTSNGIAATGAVIVVEADAPATGVTLSASTAGLVIGQSYQLSATISPTNATNKAVTWTTSDADVAKVNANGLVTATGTGSATITVKTSNEKSATCAVTVTSAVAATGITLSATSLSLEVGQMKQLTETVLPSNATDKTATWATSDAGVAKVDAKGLVTAAGVGKATITAKTSSGKSATCTVTVTAAVVLPTGVTLSDASISVEVGRMHQLSATVLPSNATDKRVTWRATDASVAKVDDKGLVTAVSAGTAIILAETANGKTGMCYVTVKPVTVPVTDVKLSTTSFSLEPEKTRQLAATVSPSNATEKAIIWSSGNTGVATVNGNGLVTGHRKGSATITAKTANGVSASCTANVATTQATLDTYVSQVIESVNQKRTENGLQALIRNEELMAKCAIRAKELETRFSHTRPDGTDYSTISPLATGENIAYGYATPEDVMTAWMNSAAHKENILRSGYNIIGVGVYEGADGQFYWVQLFG